MTLLHSITHPARIQDVLFVQDPTDSDQSVLLIAAENKKVAAYSLPPRSSELKGDDDDNENDVDDDGDDDSNDPAEATPASPAPSIFAEFVGHSNRSATPSDI
jgi:hypothetical protein